MALVLNPTILTEPVTLDAREWPANNERYSYQLIASFFNGGSVGVVAECSWDNGQTWTWSTDDTWQAGARSRSGADPGVILGPFSAGDPPQINNPTTVRLTVRPVTGSPQVGLLAD